jgi:hypothetical protein
MKPADHTVGVGAPNGGIGDHDRPAHSGGPEPFTHGIEESSAADDVVGAVRGRPSVSPREVQSDGVHSQATLTRSRSACVTVMTRAKPVC